MVTTSQPCRSIGRRQQRFNLWPREKAYQGTWLSFWLGMASTRCMTPLCAGASSEAYRKNDRMAVRRRLRLLGPLRRSFSRSSRNAPIKVPSRSFSSN